MRVRSPTEWSLLRWCIACWVLTSLSAFAAPKVSLDLPAKGPYQTDQSVGIIYRFEGVGAVDVPSTINAGGLVFRRVNTLFFPGSSRGKMRSDHGRLYFYEAVPDRPGKFVVPRRTWSVAGKKLRSPARIIEVRGASTVSETPARDGPPPPKARTFDSEQKLRDRAAAFATPPPVPAPAVSPASAGRSTTPVRPAPPTPAPARPPRNAPVVYAVPPAVAGTNVFLGQAVPVTLQFFLRADRTFQDLLRPSLDGNGFFADPMEELPPATITNNGVPYYQVTLQTTVVPLRTGPLEIPGATLQGRHTIGEAAQRSTAAGWTNFAQTSDSLLLEVAPLPADRPDDFTGGVGQFLALAPQVEPLVAPAGEPVTLRLGVEGQGNLRAMQKPVLDPASTDGWRIYDAGETVERTAADGGGTKHFEFQLIAAQDRDASPAATFSYFDPEEQKFVRLEFPSEPLNATAAPVAAEAPSPAPVPPAQNVLPPATLGPPTSFDPVLQSSWFRALQILIAFLFLGWIYWLLARRRAGRGPAARRARLRVGYQEEQEIFRAAPPDQRAFYDAAAQVVVARLGVLEGKAVPREEARRALERLVPNLAQREELAAVLDRSDELNYGALASEPVSDAERRDLERLLEEMDEKG